MRYAKMPKLTPNPAKNCWTLTNTIGYMHKGTFIVARAGMETDGASIPFFAWQIIGPPLAAKHARAAVLHDSEEGKGRLSQKAGDDMFYRVLLEDGTGKIKAATMYRALRLAGPFRKKTKGVK